MTEILVFFILGICTGVLLMFAVQKLFEAHMP